MLAGDHKGNVQPQLDLEEHDGELNAKKTSVVSTATIYAVVNIGSAGGGNVTLDAGSKTGIVGNITIANPATQYTEDDSDATPTGNLAMIWDDGASVIRAISETNPLPITDNGTALKIQDAGGSITTDWTGNVTIDSQPAWTDPKTYIGLVTITGSLSAAAGNITLDSGSLTGIIGNVTIDSIGANVNVVNIGNLTLDDGSKVGIIGNITVDQVDTVVAVTNITNPIALKGNMTLSDSKGFIGLVSVSGFANPLPVSFSGNVTLDDGSKTGIVGNITVDQVDTVVAVTDITNPVGLKGNLTIDSGTISVIGNVTVEQGDDPWVTSNIGNITVEQGDDPWNVAVIGNVTVDQVDVVTTVTAVTDITNPIALKGNVTIDSIDGVTMSNAAIQTTGDEAHDAPDAGNPIKLGMKAVASKADPTEVAADDRTDWYANVAGVPWVIGGHPNILNASINVTDADGAQTDTALVTVAANLSIVVTHAAVTAANANTVDVQFRMGFGTANTPAEDAAKQVLNHPGIAAGGGVVVGSGAGIIGQGLSNEDLRFTCGDPVTGSITVNVSYYVIAI